MDIRDAEKFGHFFLAGLGKRDRFCFLIGHIIDPFGQVLFLAAVFRVELFLAFIRDAFALKLAADLMGAVIFVRGFLRGTGDNKRRCASSMRMLSTSSTIAK